MIKENMILKNCSEESIKTYLQIYKDFKESDLNKFEFAKTLKNRNLVSMFMNSLKYANQLKESDKYKIIKIRKGKPKRRARPKEQFKVRSFWMSINNSRNIKHKLPFRLSVLTGLRIAELSNLTKQDIDFLEDGRIRVIVQNGKGRKYREVTTIMQDKYLQENLKELLKDKGNNEKVFYSKNYLHKIAKRHNFTNHDLRKTCIQKIFYSCDYDVEKTIKLIQSYLGHTENTKTYLYYMQRDINAYKTKFDI